MSEAWGHSKERSNNPTCTIFKQARLPQKGVQALIGSPDGRRQDDTSGVSGISQASNGQNGHQGAMDKGTGTTEGAPVCVV